MTMTIKESIKEAYIKSSVNVRIKFRSDLEIIRFDFMAVSDN